MQYFLIYIYTMLLNAACVSDTCESVFWAKVTHSTNSNISVFLCHCWNNNVGTNTCVALVIKDHMPQQAKLIATELVVRNCLCILCLIFRIRITTIWAPGWSWYPGRRIWSCLHVGLEQLACVQTLFPFHTFYLSKESNKNNLCMFMLSTRKPSV